MPVMILLMGPEVRSAATVLMLLIAMIDVWL